MPFVEHIVLLKTTRAFTVAEKAEVITSLRRIPGVIEVTIGANYTSRALEYTSGVIVRLSSREAEAAYQTHHEHVRVRDTILKPLLCKGSDGTPPVLAMDYDADGAPPRSWQLLGAAALVLAGVALARLR